MRETKKDSNQGTSSDPSTTIFQDSETSRLLALQASNSTPNSLPEFESSSSPIIGFFEEACKNRFRS
jgi:hypothetical protein